MNRYRMLGRLKADCDYYLGYGNGSEKNLYYESVDRHIRKMIDLHNEFEEDDKPEWLTMEDILNYEKEMKS